MSKELFRNTEIDVSKSKNASEKCIDGSRRSGERPDGKDALWRQAAISICSGSSSHHSWARLYGVDG